MLDNQTRMRSMLNLIEAVDQGKKINLNEGMPSDVIKIKQKLSLMTPDQLRSRFENVSQSTGKSVEELARSEAWRHGYGQNSDHYWKIIQKAELNEDSDSSSDVETLANDALDAAALSIQDALGVEHGDFAGTFFTGEIGENILEILRDYAREEMKNQSENDDSDYVDDEESNNSYYDSDREGDSNTRSNQFESAKSKTGKLPSMAHIKKMCKDGKTVAEICKMHPDCDRAELKQMVADCKKGALAEGVRLKKFRQVADILKTLPENNRKILAKRHCKIFENHNPRFNSKKFMTYIGLNEGDVEDFLARGGKIQQGAPTDKKTPRARNSSYTDHSMRKGEQGRRGRGYQDYDPDDHQSRNDDIDYPTKDIRKPEYESKQMNEGNGNTVQVTFVNSGYGITGDEKPQTVEKLGMDIDQNGRPILYIKSPSYGDKMQADWDAKNNRWIVDQD